MKYRESEEMYLETLLLLKRRQTNVHSIDLANELSYSRPSVSRAVGLLQRNGYITVAPDGVLNFTPAGREKAEGIYERHRVLTQLLLRAGADRELAEENACRIEHVITDELFQVLKAYVGKEE